MGSTVSSYRTSTKLAIGAPGGRGIGHREGERPRPGGRWPTASKTIWRSR